VAAFHLEEYIKRQISFAAKGHFKSTKTQEIWKNRSEILYNDKKCKCNSSELKPQSIKKISDLIQFE